MVDNRIGVPGSGNDGFVTMQYLMALVEIPRRQSATLSVQLWHSDPPMWRKALKTPWAECQTCVCEGGTRPPRSVTPVTMLPPLRPKTLV